MRRSFDPEANKYFDLESFSWTWGVKSKAVTCYSWAGMVSKWVNTLLKNYMFPKESPAAISL